MEVLAGARTEQRANDLMRLLGRCRFFPTRPLFDSTGAADEYSARRHSGFTPRTLNDCIIARIALEQYLSALHADCDFAGVAEVTGLHVESQLLRSWSACESPTKKGPSESERALPCQL